MKYLIFDAGPIISLTMNGMLGVIEKMRKEFPGILFVITPAVRKEIVDRPMKIKKYKLEAMQVRDMIERGVFTMSSKVVSDSKLKKEGQRILARANGVLRSTNTGEKIPIVHDGEASCLAFARLCGGENLIVIDERTTRMLSEAPKGLEKMMERKLHMPLDATLSLLDGMKDFRFIRSAELLFVAWKRGLVGGRKKEWLDALLYGVKFKGCAISSGEVEGMKRL
jgi:hypothetical protein